MKRNNFLLKKFGSFNFFTYLCNMKITKQEIEEVLRKTFFKSKKGNVGMYIYCYSEKENKRILENWKDIQISIIPDYNEPTN